MVTMINREWNPNYLSMWLFSQDMCWITADGVFLAIDDMVKEHALNTLLMLERVERSLIIREGTLQVSPLYLALKARVLA